MGRLTDPPIGGKGLAPAHRRLFAAVVAEAGLIRNTALRRRVAERDVDDVVQRVFIQAWKRIARGRFVVAPNVEPRPMVRAWLRHLARQEAGRARRARYFEIAHEEQIERDGSDQDDESEGVYEAHNPVDPMDRILTREGLRLITYRLNRREKALLGALAREATMREIAALVGVEHATAAVLVFRLRKHLRRNLER